MVRAHRMAWTIFRGPITREQHVLHRCDNRLCVNPKHLFLGDQAANMADKKQKGRQDRGEKHGMAKLTESEALRIIEDRRTFKEIAADYKITMTTVSNIKTGWSWPHLDRSKLFLRKRGERPTSEDAQTGSA